MTQAEALREIIRETHDRRDFHSRRVNGLAVAMLREVEKGPAVLATMTQAVELLRDADRLLADCADWLVEFSAADPAELLGRVEGWRADLALLEKGPGK